MQKLAIACILIPHISKVQMMRPVALICIIEVCYNIFKNFRSIVHCNAKVEKP